MKKSPMHISTVMRMAMDTEGRRNAYTYDLARAADFLTECASALVTAL